MTNDTTMMTMENVGGVAVVKSKNMIKNTNQEDSSTTTTMMMMNETTIPSIAATTTAKKLKMFDHSTVKATTAGSGNTTTTNAAAVMGVVVNVPLDDDDVDDDNDNDLDLMMQEDSILVQAEEELMRHLGEGYHSSPSLIGDTPMNHHHMHDNDDEDCLDDMHLPDGDDDEEITSIESGSYPQDDDNEVVEHTMVSMAMMNSVVDQKKKRGRRALVANGTQPVTTTTTTTTDTTNHDDNNSTNIDNVKSRLRKSRKRANQDLEKLEYNQSHQGVGGLAYTTTTTTTTTTSIQGGSSKSRRGGGGPDTILLPPSSVPNPLQQQQQQLPRTSSSTSLQPQHPRTSSVSIDTIASNTSESLLLPPSSSTAVSTTGPTKMVNFADSTFDSNHPTTTMTSHSPYGGGGGNRMRGFSIDLDSLGLEFPDDNSTTAIHNTLTGAIGTISNHNNNHNHHNIGGGSSSSSGGRNRAFSFECFAFGINADEPLPPLEQQQHLPTLSTSSNIHSSNIVPLTSLSSSPVAQHAGGGGGVHNSVNSYDSHNNYDDNNNTDNINNFNTQQRLQSIPEKRPRGDSIIFDPASFQDGGIHELLPGLIEQQQHQQGHDIFTSVSSTTNTGDATNANSFVPQYKQQQQRSSTSQHQTLVSSRPSVNHITHSKPRQQHPTAAVSSSSIPFTTKTTSSTQLSSATITSHPPSHQQRKSITMTSATTNATASASQQDMVTTINSDGTTTTISLELCNKDGRIGIYLPEARTARIARFHAKRSNRIWRKRIKYDCRKKLADSRPRIKGRFVKRTDMDE